MKQRLIVVPNSSVVSSANCAGAPDGLHFTAAGYRLLGKKYALKMFSILGYKVNKMNGLADSNR